MTRSGYRKRPPTHDELGESLIKQWDGKVAFFYGAWHIYENGLWRPRTESEVSLDLWGVQIKHKPDGIDPTQGRCASVEHYCRSHLTVVPDKLTKSDQYISLENGIFDTRNREFTAHDQALFMTHQLPFKFDNFAQCPQWLAFVESALVKPDGMPDVQLIQLFQEMCCYCLSAETHHRAAFFLVGPKGSGKSTLLNILIAIAGDSHVAISLEDLNNPYTLASVAGRRLVTFSEPDTRVPLADGAFKKLVSKDAVPARQIYGTPFSFVPKCKLAGSMNAMPKVLDRSGAVFDRIIIIPVIRAVPKESRDLYLEERLKQELPGIFNWMIAGQARLKMQGRFTIPQQTEAAIDEYQFENDIPRQWVDELGEAAPGFSMTLDTLHGSFQAWSASSGYQGMGKITFRRELNRLGFQHIRKGGTIYILGLKLKQKKGIF
jgi:putative DNA primase/helicase